MSPQQLKKTSKFLSLLLRHKPETIGLQLDAQGWADTEELLSKMNARDFSLSLEDLKAVVANNDKQRFAFSDDYARIRANQGHSITIDLGLETKAPPETLYHGTATRNLDSIQEKGLLKGQRHQVHLSQNTTTAIKVGKRYGKPVVLTVKAKEMHEQGIVFYQSENGVWLTEYVAPGFIEFPE